MEDVGGPEKDLGVWVATARRVAYFLAGFFGVLAFFVFGLAAFFVGVLAFFGLAAAFFFGVFTFLGLSAFGLAAAFFLGVLAFFGLAVAFFLGDFLAGFFAFFGFSTLVLSTLKDPLIWRIYSHLFPLEPYKPQDTLLVYMHLPV